MQSIITQTRLGGDGFANSPLYECKSGCIVTINTTDPYCVVAGGARRMEHCCLESSNGKSKPNLRPDCYSWCNLDVADRGIVTERLMQMQRKFGYCLQHGTNASESLQGLLCEIPGLNETPHPPNASTSLQPPGTSTGVSGPGPTATSGAIRMRAGALLGLIMFGVATEVLV